MINPMNPDDRARLSSSIAHWKSEHDGYRLARKEMIMHHAGSPKFASLLGINIEDKSMMGNLIQMGATAHSLSLAYNCPQYKFVAQVPEAESICPRLQAGVNRYTHFLGLGDIARACALDSYFGFAIINVCRMELPPMAKNALGIQFGPGAVRVSQDNFLFDGQATDFQDISWLGHTFLVQLEVARNFPGFNPVLAAGIQEFRNTGGQPDSKISAMGSHVKTAMPMAKLMQIYFPHNNTIAIWSVSDDAFSGIKGEPLLCQKFDGHYSGPYAVMSMLDIPDNLIPVSPCESVKALHILFNQLTDITANQALSAKYNPVFQQGFVRDMERLTNTADREPVPVTDISKIGSWTIPGPDQSQTMYTGAVLGMFKEFSGNLDDILGTGATAPTATQSELIRSAVSVRSADKRNRMHRFMADVGRKLAHYFLTTPDFMVPARETLPGTPFSVDMSWLPESLLPRGKQIDHFVIDIIAYSLEYRDPATRLAQLSTAIKEIIAVMQAAAQGAPIDIGEFIELQADFRDLPELRRLWNGLLPEYTERKGAARQASQQREGVGQYARTSVSEKTNGGALMENLAQTGGANGQAGIRMAGAA